MKRTTLFANTMAIQEEAEAYEKWLHVVELSYTRCGESATSADTENRLCPMQVLIKFTDKAIRNKLSLIKSKGVKGFERILGLKSY